jgi:CheY-like chemotaxis protein
VLGHGAWKGAELVPPDQIRRRAWVIEDNAKSRTEANEALRSLAVEPRMITTLEEFATAMSDVSDGGPPPDVVIVDLRLPWADNAQLAANALVDGLSCLTSLRGQPKTAAVPVVIYSAFVHDELVMAELKPHRPFTVVDKLEPARLAIVVNNLLPDRPARKLDRAKRLGRASEGMLLRVAAAVAAGTAVVGCCLAFARWVL